MPARLAAFLAANEPDATDIEVTGYEVMTGGYSRLLARADVTWRRAGTLEQTSFVLRGDPPADRSLIHTDRAYEWAVLKAVEGRVRVARAQYFDSTGEHLGTKAIVLEHSAAESFLPNTARRGDDLGELHLRLADAAASIHTIPIDDLPAEVERPKSWDDYIGRRIDEWRQTALDHVEAEPFLRYVAAWLDAHRPPEVPLTLDPRRLPVRQPAGRRGRRARDPGLGAGAGGRSEGGPRLLQGQSPRPCRPTSSRSTRRPSAPATGS